MKHCFRCGDALPEDSFFCPFCGVRLDVPDGQAPVQAGAADTPSVPEEPSAPPAAAQPADPPATPAPPPAAAQPADPASTPAAPPATPAPPPARRVPNALKQRPASGKTPARPRVLPVVLTVLVVLLAGLNVWQYVAENAQLASLEQKVQTRDALIDMQEHQLAQLERQRRELVDAVNYDILGYASPSFYAEKGVVMVNRTLRDPFFNLWADFDDSVEIDIETEGDSVELDFADEDWYTWNVWGVWDGGTVVRITPREPGLTVATFRNSLNDQSFRVFLIVD